MKSVSCWSIILWVFSLQVMGLQGQEKSVGEELARLIRDADDVRFVLVDDVDQFTAYQSVVPAGNKALAQTFADATMKPLRLPDGSNDPGGFGLSRYMLINVRRNGELVGDIVLGGYLVYVIKPGGIWHKAHYKDTPWWINTFPAEKAHISERALKVVQTSVQQGSGWKKVEGSLKRFLNFELPDD